MWRRISCLIILWRIHTCTLPTAPNRWTQLFVSNNNVKVHSLSIDQCLEEVILALGGDYLYLTIIFTWYREIRRGNFRLDVEKIRRPEENITDVGKMLDDRWKKYRQIYNNLWLKYMENSLHSENLSARDEMLFSLNIT